MFDHINFGQRRVVFHRLGANGYRQKENEDWVEESIGR